MDFPAELKEALSHLKEASSDSALVELAAKDSRLLTTFFEAAAFDETWASHHPEAIKLALKKLSDLYAGGNLSQELAERAARSIREHHSVVLRQLDADLKVLLKDGQLMVSCLLFGTVSTLFGGLLSSIDRSDGSFEVHIPDVTVDVFRIIHAYMETGQSGELWRMEYPLVLQVYQRAIEWEIKGLPMEAAAILKRYVTHGNFVKLLKECISNRWQEYYTEILKIAGTYDVGLQFALTSVEYLAVEFSDYRESALDIFEELKPFITHLGFFGPIVEDTRFTYIIKEVPGLIGIRLNEVKAFTNRFLDIPYTLEELDISMNPWMTSDELKVLIEQCKELKKLNLKNDTGIDYKGFGYLKKLTRLESLTLTKCTQIKEEELLLICQCCPKLLHLDLEGCERLGGKAFETLSKMLPRLETLSISRLSISDAELIELTHRLKNLQELNLERTDSFSDSGIIESVQVSYNLKRLKLKHTPVSPGAREKIQHMRPSLHID